MSQSIIVRNQDGNIQVAPSPEAIQLRDEALAVAKPWDKPIDSPEDEAAAVKQAAILKGIEQQAEKDRKAVKQPFLEIGKSIDAQAAEYTAPVSPLRSRIEAHISAYRTKLAHEAAERAEEERRRQAEAAKRATEEAQRAEELRRREEALKAQAEQARTKAAQEKAMAEAKKIEEERKSAEWDAALAKEAAEEQPVLQAAPEVAKGGAFKTVVDFRELDIFAFIGWEFARREANPRDLRSFVKFEISRALFKDYINTIPLSEAQKIPGVEVFEDSKFTAKGRPTHITLSQ